MRERQSQAFAEQFEYYLASVKGSSSQGIYHEDGKNVSSEGALDGKPMDQRRQLNSNESSCLAFPSLQNNAHDEGCSSSSYAKGHRPLFKAYGPHCANQGISYTLPAREWGACHKGEKGLPPPHPRPASLRRAHNTPPTVWNYSQGNFELVLK